MDWRLWPERAPLYHQVDDIDSQALATAFRQTGYWYARRVATAASQLTQPRRAGGTA